MCCRSGKTSIQEVLFNNLPAKQTFYLERTSRTTKYPYECVHFYPIARAATLTFTVLAQLSPSRYGIVLET